MTVAEYIKKHGIYTKYTKKISLYNRDITSLEGLSFFKNLQTLNLLKNHIKDINALFEHVTLKDLDLRDNPVTDIKGIEKLELLEFLYLDVNKIEDISPILKLSKLILINNLCESKINRFKRKIKYHKNIKLMLKIK